MRIVMIGAGAMGAMFVGRFAGAGSEVVLYDRDEAHVAAIAEKGLIVSTPSGESGILMKATSRLEDIGEVDAAVVLVDSNATRAAAEIAARILPSTAYALTLQNGVGNIEVLVEALGAERVVAGSTYNSAAKLAPGSILHSNLGETTIGELDGKTSARITALAELFRRAGLPVAVSDNVVGHVWMKFVLNAALNPVSAVTGLRSGEIMRAEPARRLLDAVLREILEVVAAKGLRLPKDDPRTYILDHAWQRYNRPSMLQHVEQGRRTEIDALNGALLREAKALGITCPFNEAIVFAVKSIEARPWRSAGHEVDEAALEKVARETPRPPD